MLRFTWKESEICEEIEKQVRIQYHLLPEEEGTTQASGKAATPEMGGQKNKTYDGSLSGTAAGTREGTPVFWNIWTGRSVVLPTRLKQGRLL